jgi:hypothetical protein
MTEETQIIEGVADVEIPLYVYNIKDGTELVPKGFYYLIGGYDEQGDPLPVPNPFESSLIVGPFDTGDAALDAGIAKINATEAEMDAEEAKFEFIEEERKTYATSTEALAAASWHD